MMARRCPSTVWRAIILISSTVLPRNCSAAVRIDDSSPRIFTCATPSTTMGTPGFV
jgi:hypothetical protein